MRLAEDSLRVTDDDLNDVYTRVGFGIIEAGSLIRNAASLPSVLFEFRFLLILKVNEEGVAVGLYHLQVEQV